MTFMLYERSARFGPKGQPFFCARFDDGTMHMIPGLNPTETIDFVTQHRQHGFEQDQIDRLLATLAQRPYPGDPDA